MFSFLPITLSQQLLRVKGWKGEANTKSSQKFERPLSWFNDFNTPRTESNLYLIAIVHSTVNSVEVALWLANQTQNILFYSSQSTLREICFLKYCN